MSDDKIQSVANVFKRDRAHYSRYSRFSRHSRFSFKQEDDYKIRKSLADYVHDELDLQGRTLFYQRVTVLAKNLVLPGPRNSKMAEDEVPPPADFKSSIQEHLEEIIEDCDIETFTDDKVTGLFLCMGEYTLLVVEGTEDMVGVFFAELSKITPLFWQTTRVFLIEDKIEETYFETFIFRRSSAVHINEKFSPATPNDVDLMSVQHWRIKERLVMLCETLSKQLREQEAPSVDDTLPSEEYNKLLPEVQRIDIVLIATRFYRTLPSYAATYGTIPMAQDEDALLWPVPYNYLPVGIFNRSPYDVNLTFSDYGKEESKEHEEEGGASGGAGEDEEPEAEAPA